MLPNSEPSQTPLVSVIVRSMGRPQLAQALESLAQQTYLAAEILVVDARGTNRLGLPKRCGNFNLRMVNLGRPLLRPAAANAGLDDARGELITFLDEDDFCDPAHLATLAGALTGDPTVGLAYVGLRVFEQEDAEPAFVLHLEHSLEFLFERNYLNLQAAMFRRSFVTAGQRFDEEFEILEDWDFFLGLALRTRFLRLESVTANYRGHLGTSGAGGAGNHDPQGLQRYVSQLHKKWNSIADPYRERARQSIENGLRAQRAGNWALAEQHYAEVLLRNPHDLNALNLAGMARLRCGDFGRSLVLLRRAVAIKNDAPGLFHNLGLALEGAGEQVLARAAFAQALQLDPAFAPARIALQRHSQAIEGVVP